MPTQLTTAEQTDIDKVLRSGKGGPMDALRKINNARALKNIEEVVKSTIYRFVKGNTHKRGKKEIRGKQKLLRKADIARLERVRKRLLKVADSTRRVTYKEIQEQAGLKGKCSERVVQDALRAQGVRFRAPRRKVYLTEDDAKGRLKLAKMWVKRPASFWSDNVHAYVDNKAWPLPLTPAQRAKYKKTRVTGHLRKPEEGVARGFTKPREKHSFLGLPSVTISAAVGKGKVIMWHTVAKSWNGTTAAEMYKGPLSTALEKTWGRRRRYTIIEDGDRKGNQSGLGLAAKQEKKIHAMTLPPRTPAWMPLDYAIWTQIEKKMDETDPEGRESKGEYLARLQKCAKSLPRSFVEKVVARMKDNIQGVIDANGYHAKND